MKISRIRLTNFRCYRGRQDWLDLSTTPSANLVIIFGENMKGKTSLLQSIRWGLYGSARDRQGREIPLVDPETKEQLLSRDAESEGDYSLAVEIEFRHENETHMLRRSVSAARKPTEDGDFAVSRELKVGTRVLSEGSIDPYIQNMLSEDVSRFFLFDAEMLEEYEDLLKNPEKESLAVKGAIEKVVGLPALQVFSSFRNEAAESEQQQNAYLRKKAKHDNLLEELARLENAVRGKTSDVAELESEHARLQQQVNDAELAVRKNADIDAKIREKNVLEGQIETEANRLRDAQRAIAAVLQTTWWLPVVPQIQRRIDNLRADRSQAISAIQSLNWLEKLEESRVARACALCGTGLDHSALKRVQDEATRVKLENYGVNLASLFDALKRAEVYEKYNSGDALAQVRVREETCIEAEIAIAELETRIREITAGMGERAYGDYTTKYERWQRLGAQLTGLESRIKDQRADLKILIEERDRKQGQANKSPDADPTLAYKTSVYRFMADIFECGVETFRDSLRDAIGADASDIFRRLTTEPAYQGLAIDENYGLALLDSQGRPVPGRSAGAEQIVALSLIGGLNRAAVREGPVVMDSNFARLDQGHRANVLRFLPYLGSQVIVLVHSGEIGKDEDLGEAGKHVARRYEVVPVSETISRIVPEVV